MAVVHGACCLERLSGCGGIACAFICSFSCILYYEDVLAMYFKANFELNSHIPDVFYTRRFIHPSFEMTVPLLLAFYALARCVWSGNLYVKSSVRFSHLNTSFVLLFHALCLLFAFLHAVASTMAGVAASEMIRKRQWLALVFAGYLSYSGEFMPIYTVGG